MGIRSPSRSYRLPAQSGRNGSGGVRSDFAASTASVSEPHYYQSVRVSFSFRTHTFTHLTPYHTLPVRHLSRSFSLAPAFGCSACVKRIIVDKFANIALFGAYISTYACFHYTYSHTHTHTDRSLHHVHECALIYVQARTRDSTLVCMCVSYVPSGQKSARSRNVGAHNRNRTQQQPAAETFVPHLLSSALDWSNRPNARASTNTRLARRDARPHKSHNVCVHTRASMQW